MITKALYTQYQVSLSKEESDKLGSFPGHLVALVQIISNGDAYLQDDIDRDGKLTGTRSFAFTATDDTLPRIIAEIQRELDKTS